MKQSNLHPFFVPPKSSPKASRPCDSPSLMHRSRPRCGLLGLFCGRSSAWRGGPRKMGGHVPKLCGSRRTFHFFLKKWLVNLPSLTYPPPKALLRAYEPLVSLNKVLLNPYFWGGGRLTSHDLVGVSFFFGWIWFIGWMAGFTIL